MPTDPTDQAITEHDTTTSLAQGSAVLAGTVLLAQSMTDTHVIQACDLDGIVHAHCYVYATTCILGALQMGVQAAFGKRGHRARWALMCVKLLILVVGPIALQEDAIRHRRRVLNDHPACRHALGGSILAFSWHTYAFLDLFSCVLCSLLLIGFAVTKFE